MAARRGAAWPSRAGARACRDSSARRASTWGPGAPSRNHRSVSHSAQASWSRPAWTSRNCRALVRRPRRTSVRRSHSTIRATARRPRPTPNRRAWSSKKTGSTAPWGPCHTRRGRTASPVIDRRVHSAESAPPLTQAPESASARPPRPSTCSSTVSSRRDSPPSTSRRARSRRRRSSSQAGSGSGPWGKNSATFEGDSSRPPWRSEAHQSLIGSPPSLVRVVCIAASGAGNRRPWGELFGYGQVGVPTPPDHRGPRGLRRQAMPAGAAGPRQRHPRDAGGGKLARVDLGGLSVPRTGRPRGRTPVCRPAGRSPDLAQRLNRAVSHRRPVAPRAGSLA